MARRRDHRGPGRQPPGRLPGRQSGRPQKEGPVRDAVKRALNEEIKGVPSAEILMHLRAIGLDTETARTIYSHVREEVAKIRRRTMWAMMILGAVMVIASMGLLLTMTTRWTDTRYVWWILVSLMAVIGLLLLAIGQTKLKRLQQPRVEGTRKVQPPGKGR